LAEKVKLAEVWFVGSAGPSAIELSGAVRSIVQEYESGLVSVLPARSMARTSKLCPPSASGP
jgi:hypothetical protein